MHGALPRVRQWIDNYLRDHSRNSQPVVSLGFPRLPSYCPPTLLASAKVVFVERVEFPPVHEFGLPEFAPLRQADFAGITFKDTYFVRREHGKREALHAHELVHIVQWERLGVDNFVLAYGAGLAQFGYEQSPLERMAYEVQAAFEQGHALMNLVRTIEQQTDRVWQAAAPSLAAR